MCVQWALSVVSSSLWSHGLQHSWLLRPWDFPGKKTGVGCHFLLQGIFRLSDGTWVSCVSCTGRQIFHHWASWKAHVYGKNYNLKRYMHTMFIAALFQFSCSVVSNSLWPHGLQHARLPCSSPTLRACHNSWPLSRWCHPTTSVKTRKQPKWPLTEEWINEMWYI